MIKIKLSCDVSAAAKRAVEKFAEEIVLDDCNFSGAEIAVEYDDYTCVEDSNDAYRGASLLYAVQHVIDEAEGRTDA